MELDGSKTKVSRVGLMQGLMQGCIDNDGGVDMLKLKSTVITEFGWTEDEADEVIRLAMDYGYLFLSDAFCLALVLDIKDRNLGF